VRYLGQPHFHFLSSEIRRRLASLLICRRVPHTAKRVSSDQLSDNYTHQCVPRRAFIVDLPPCCRLYCAIAETHKPAAVSMAHQTPKPVIANCVPKLVASAPMDPHLTHDSYGPCGTTAQTASLSVQPSLHR